MAQEKVQFRSHARKVLDGTTRFANAVRVTLGPKAKSVLIGRKSGRTFLCYDCDTLDLEAAEEALGDRMPGESGVPMGGRIGDGTCPEAVRAGTVLADGMRNPVAGMSAIYIKSDLDRDATRVGSELKAMLRPAQTSAEKKQVATISARNAPRIGDPVGEAIDRVGDTGMITVEGSRATGTVLKVAAGRPFDGGLISPHVVTRAERMGAGLAAPRILLDDRMPANSEKTRKGELECIKGGRP